MPSTAHLERTTLACLTVCGELDVAAAPDLDAALRDRSITVVDLAGVTFVDVAGVRPLLHAAASEERALHLLRPSACVRRLFGLLHVSLDDGRAVLARDGWAAAPPLGDGRPYAARSAGARSSPRRVHGTGPPVEEGRGPQPDASSTPPTPAAAGWSSSSSDPDRPLDQLVDEVLDRIGPLHAVLGLASGPVDPAAVRRAGAAVLAAVRTDGAGVAAAQLEDALWSTSRGGRAPTGWFATPLGALIARSGRGDAPASPPPGSGDPSDHPGADRHPAAGPDR